MKLKKLKKTKRLTPKLQLVELSHKKKLQTSEISLNKIISVVARFDRIKTKILFLGFPNDFSKTFKHSKHLFLPNAMWLNGTISNRNFKYQTKKLASLNKRDREFKLSLKQEKKVDLIVVYDLDTNSEAIKESYLSNTPIISISKRVDIHNNRALFNSTKTYAYVSGKTKDMFSVFSLLKSVLLKKKVWSRNIGILPSVSPRKSGKKGIFSSR